MAPSSASPPLVAGIDVATADVRVCVADGQGRVVARTSAPLAAPHRPGGGISEQEASSWWPAVTTALREALSYVDGPVDALAVSATSGTVVLVDRRGDPVGPAILYDDGRVPAPRRWDLLVESTAGEAAHAWHASDLIVARLTGAPPVTDWSHALKTGYDPEHHRWGDAGAAAAIRPDVAAPASPAGTVCAAAARETGLRAGASVRLGMTDACAAQVAAGADRPGRFVSVLGTTLVVKGASRERLDDQPAGVYSHRHPDGWWLPGGASNTGGGSLTARFGRDELAGLDRRAQARGPSTTVCYPLPGTGERFPFAAGDATELWAGPPADGVDAYRAVLEGVAFVERLGYERLGALGAPLEGPLRTAGAGSASAVWTAIRATVLDVGIVRPQSSDTSFGACILAAAGTLHESLSAATEAMVLTADGQTEPVAAERDRLDDSYGRFVAALGERGWLPWRR